LGIVSTEDTVAIDQVIDRKKNNSLGWSSLCDCQNQAW